MSPLSGLAGGVSYWTVDGSCDELASVYGCVDAKSEGSSSSSCRLVGSISKIGACDEEAPGSFGGDGGVSSALSKSLSSFRVGVSTALARLASCSASGGEACLRGRSAIGS